MNIVIWIFVAYIGIVLLCALLYLPKLRQLAGAFKLPPQKHAGEKRRIAVVIPARNESKVIGDLFRSILAQDCDASLFDINVIVKSEDDPTVRMAEHIGANVFVVKEQTCKGEALDGYFKAIGERLSRYDAFVIVDADAVLSPDYISRLQDALEYDRDIFVTRKNCKNFLGDKQLRTLVTDCSALVYPTVDECANLYRAEKNIPLNICGQGLMVRRRVIEKTGGWPYRSLTEDYELKMDSALRGFTSMYYPYAVIYTEEVLTHRESFIRRVRWISGFMQCKKKYGREVKKKLREEHAPFATRYDFNFSLLPMALYLVATVLTVLLGAGCAAVFWLHGSELFPAALAWLIAAPLGLTYLLLWLFALLNLCAYRDALTALPLYEKVLTLFAFPFFLLEFVPVALVSFAAVRKNKLVWKQPVRNELGENAEEELRTEEL